MRCFATVSISAILLVIGFSGCQPATPELEVKPLTGAYLGQTVPGTVPQLFAAAAVAVPFDIRDTAWSPDGDQLFYTVWGRGRGTIAIIGRSGGSWGQHEIAQFSGRYSDLEAFVTSSGDELYFASKRPMPGEEEEKDWDLWILQRSESGWGEPENLGSTINTTGGEYYPSLTTDGTLYFTAEREDSLGGEDIYMSRRLADGGWEEPDNLGPAVNSPGPEFNALIAPDESYLIFGSVREGDVGGGDLHIAFRDEDGSWLPSKNMGPSVNSPTLDYCPALSPDGKYLFFTSRRVPDDQPRPSTYGHLAASLRGPLNGSSNIWWVDAAVIDRLRP